MSIILRYNSVLPHIKQNFQFLGSLYGYSIKITLNQAQCKIVIEYLIKEDKLILTMIKVYLLWEKQQK